ncbi:MAG: helix-turn-helix domain-containing protein [Acidobacteriota bacterium]|nr:helix-turn-helix domain-containing protein [Acidobacteriota bacterium]
MIRFLTVKEICLILAVSRGTVIRWIRSGRLPAIKLGDGRCWRVREQDLKEFTERI